MAGQSPLGVEPVLDLQTSKPERLVITIDGEGAWLKDAGEYSLDERIELREMLRIQQAFNQADSNSISDRDKATYRLALARVGEIAVICSDEQRAKLTDDNLDMIAGYLVARFFNRARRGGLDEITGDRESESEKAQQKAARGILDRAAGALNPLRPLREKASTT